MVNYKKIAAGITAVILSVSAAGISTGTTCKIFTSDYTVSAESLSDSVTDNTGCTEDGLTYEIKNNEVIIHNCNNESAEVIIPEEIKGYPVTAIDSFDSDNLTTITIPDSVNSICSTNFNFCRKLSQINVYETNTRYTSVDGVLFSKDKTTIVSYPTGKEGRKYDIPQGVTRIEHHAFMTCSQLTDVTIPDGLEIVGENAFAGCRSLGPMVLPDSVQIIGKAAFENSGIREINIPDGVKTIEKNTFFGCMFLGNISLPDSITSIGESAFNGCINKEFSEIVIPGYVTDIGTRAFANCSSLKKVILPHSLSVIKPYTFYDCASLSEIEIPDSIEKIENDAFSDCKRLVEINIPSSVTDIDDTVFNNCMNLSEINVSQDNPEYSSVDGIMFNEDKTWLCCYPAGKSDKVYIVPEGVISIYNCAFMGCSTLNEIILPDSITEIRDSAFERCTNIKKITLPDNLKFIDRFVFKDCSSIEEISIPEGVKSLEEGIFEGCSSLKKIILPQSIIEMTDLAFDKTNTDCLVYIKSGSYVEKFLQDNNVDFVSVVVENVVDGSGDINGDEKVTVWDFVMIKQYLTGATVLDESEKKAADTNGDGKVNIIDCIRIKSMILGK